MWCTRCWEDWIRCTTADVTAGLRELMMQQEFVKSPLYSAVFPVGDQDSAQLLLDSVGGDEKLARERSQVGGKPSDARKAGLLADSPPRSCLLSGCGLDGH